MFNKKTLALLCLAFLLLAGNSWAQPLKQKEVLETLTKVNGYFIFDDLEMIDSSIEEYEEIENEYGRE